MEFNFHAYYEAQAQAPSNRCITPPALPRGTLGTHTFCLLLHTSATVLLTMHLSHVARHSRSLQAVQTLSLAMLSLCYHVQAVRTWYPAGLSSRALPIDPSAWAVAPISELPRSPAPPLPRSQLIPPELMSSVSAGPLVLPFIAVLITGWGSQGATVTWTRDLYPGRTQQK